MKFISKSRYWLTPDIEDNLSLPEKEQLQIEIIRPTAETINDLTKVSAIKAEDGSIKMDTDFNVRKILKEHVGKIRNLEIEISDGDSIQKKNITDGAELSGASFYGVKALVSIICAQVVTDRLSEEEKKITE